jgi:hypothetical protein
MDTTPPHVVIVADRPELNPALAAAVGRRAAAVADCRFTLLVPAVARGLHRAVDPEDACCAEAQATLEYLLPPLEAAAGAPIAGRIGAHEVLAAIEDVVNAGDVTEVIVATAGAPMWRWLRIDLPRKVAALGVSVTAIPTPARTGRRAAA